MSGPLSADTARPARRRLMLLAAGGVAFAVAAALTVYLLTRDRVPPATRAGRALAAGLVATLDAAEDTAEPYRCARDDFAAADASATVDGERMVLGVVADARNPVSVEALRRARAVFEEAGVTLAVSLGGMGETEVEIAAALAPLGRDAPWTLLALPGDREDVGAHRRAVADLGALDGARVRLVELGGATLATYPGVESGAQLVADAEGCLHAPGDGTALASVIAGRTGPRVVLSYAAPRQRGERGSDLAPGGIHAGERAWAEAVAGAGAALIVHGQIEVPAAERAAEGEIRLAPDAAPDAAPAIVAAGAADVLPAPGRAGPTALIVALDGERLEWKRVPLEARATR